MPISEKHETNPFEILPENQECPEGNEIRTADRCREADDWAIAMKINPKRPALDVDVEGVPYGCSVQVKGDKTIHFNKKRDTNNKRFTSGEFVRICEKGLYFTYLVVYCHLSSTPLNLHIIPQYLYFIL